MSTSSAFIAHINPRGSGADEENKVHQSSPHWVLSFVQWAVRDTLRDAPTKDKNALTTRGTEPLVVENDCITCSVNVSKGTLTPSMNATLIHSDVNYMTAIAPGDFVFVNMLNWDVDARRVANTARGKPDKQGKIVVGAINGFNDGFKGVFKVQSVRRVVQVDPGSGTRTVVFRITGFGFTEFNNTVYFQPEMITSNEQKNVGLFASNIQSNWSLLVSDKGLTAGQDLIRAVVESFIGSGIGDNGIRDKNGTVRSPNTLFFIPQLVGTLLGVTGAMAAKDIYNFIFGIQQYAGGSSATAAAGLNPVNIGQTTGRFINLTKKIQSESLNKPEYWNQVKLWSIMNQYVNSPLNEMFTSFRTAPNGSVMPTVVLRQIPFTTEDFKKGSFETTKFMSLPRWKINPSMVYSLDIGRDESARINFVQYFGRSALSSGKLGTSSETAAENYLFDIDDVKRSGLRPYVVSGNFDITRNDQAYASPYWARIVGDALIGGHLKLNGTIECVGITEPIAVGDNLEFDGMVFHIEEVAHSASYGPDGQRLFRTRISLSSGLNKHSSAYGTRYSEMAFTAGHENRENDFENNKILPGVTESQDVVYRSPENLDQPASKNGSFPQPVNGVNIENSTRADGKSKKEDKK